MNKEKINIAKIFIDGFTLYLFSNKDTNLRNDYWPCKKCKKITSKKRSKFNYI